MNLVQIPGLGPRTRDKLAEEGISTLADLARADVRWVARVCGFSRDRAMLVVRIAQRRVERFDDAELVARPVDASKSERTRSAEKARRKKRKKNEKPEKRKKPKEKQTAKKKKKDNDKKSKKDKKNKRRKKDKKSRKNKHRP